MRESLPPPGASRGGRWLDEILSPVGRAAFLAGSWNRSLLHLPGRGGRFAALLDWAGLARLLEWTPLQPPRLALVRGGNPVPAARYLQVKEDIARIDAGKLAVELEQGATLIVNFIDEMAPNLGALADEVAEALQVRANINLYASWKAENGLALHWDTHGVMVLQLAGRKHWTVHVPTLPDPIAANSFVPPAAGAEPLWTGILDDGDVLYLPRGHPHVANAVDGPSLHLTVSLIEPTGIGFLRWLVEELADDAALRAALPMPGDPAADEVWLAGLRDALRRRAEPRALASYRSARSADKPARPRFELPGLGRSPPREWSDATRFRLASERAARLRYAPDGGARIRFGGRDWPCAASLAAALATLSSKRAVALVELGQGLGGDELRDLRRLLALMLTSGALFAEPGDS